MADDVLQQIRDSYHNLDINSLESELEAQRQIDYESGDFDESPDEDANVPDAMPLENAIEIQRVSKSPVFQNIFRALRELHADFVNKSKDEKQNADYRSLFHTTTVRRNPRGGRASIVESVG
jgi:hypothetical protein